MRDLIYTMRVITRLQDTATRFTDRIYPIPARRNVYPIDFEFGILVTCAVQIPLISCQKSSFCTDSKKIVAG
jgi:hypothetical protein